MNMMTQSLDWLMTDKTAYSNLFPAVIDTGIMSWVLMLGIPLAMLFLAADKWQYRQQFSPVKVEVQQQHPSVTGKVPRHPY
jgi:protein-S-isoprenylcysteine O-methyltransferase Ste14